MKRIETSSFTEMKRILSLDGGGVRGMFSLQILKRMESLYAQQRDRPDLVLADEFDLFAGTSTGAIIATGLAWGLRVAELEQMYFDYGPAMFRRAPWWSRWRSMYDAESLAAFFRDFFRDTSGAPALLGTDRLRKLLLVVMRNASTGAPWPLTNNPCALYNHRSRVDCNLDIPLWQVLRASTAAPGYFPPQEIRIAERTDLFVDGGITPYNNPALIAVLTATLAPYQLTWETGRDNLHVVSVGTGSIRHRFTKAKAKKIHMLDQIGHAVAALIGSAMVEQDVICRILGDCLHGAPIDSEIGALTPAGLAGTGRELFSYVRYDLALDSPDSRQLRHAETKLDNLALMPLLREMGQRYATVHVKLDHLRASACSEPL